MLEVSFSPRFIKRYRMLEKELCDEAYEKIELFKNKKNHPLLKVHKLKGRFLNSYSFSVNYKTRIVFEYLSKKEVVLLTIGDHDVYR